MEVITDMLFLEQDLEYRDFLGVRGLYCDANIKDTAVILKKTKK